jgi:hypothetical protein
MLPSRRFQASAVTKNDDIWDTRSLVYEEEPVIRAMWHARHTGHRLWHEEMIWSGERATVYFCSCGEEFWPLTKKGSYPDWRDNPIRRERVD